MRTVTCYCVVCASIGTTSELITHTQPNLSTIRAMCVSFRGYKQTHQNNLNGCIDTLLDCHVSTQRCRLAANMATPSRQNYRQAAVFEPFYTGGPARVSNDGTHLACACGGDVKVRARRRWSNHQQRLASGAGSAHWSRGCNTCWGASSMHGCIDAPPYRHSHRMRSQSPHLHGRPTAPACTPRPAACSSACGT